MQPLEEEKNHTTSQHQKQKSCNLSAQKITQPLSTKKHITQPLEEEKKITQPLSTKTTSGHTKNTQPLGTQKNHKTSWHKKIMQPLDTKKITQPLGTKKITQPPGTTKKKSRTLLSQKNLLTSWHTKKS